jgi:DtxR family Mn-dependent transcriptional regulator
MDNRIRRMMNNREIEEVLEAVWTAEEAGNTAYDEVARRCHISISEEMVRELENQDFLERRGEKLVLTEQGRTRAAAVIRRHRLAERLLTDVLNMNVEQAEASACEYEHALVPEVTESICTLLGHPRRCPHGTPIPEGRCCREARSVIREVAVPLTRLAVGGRGRVAYLRSGSHGRLSRLLSLGICPGTLLTLEQVKPAFVVRIGTEETELALEQDVAEDVFVWSGDVRDESCRMPNAYGRRRRGFGFGRRRACDPGEDSFPE